MKKTLLLLIITLMTFSVRADFYYWTQQLAQKARMRGVSDYTVQQFLQTAQPYERAIESDNSQAEFKKFIWDYLNSALSSQRIQTGKQKFATYGGLLNAVSQQTGVSPQIITAIWGLETSYGGYTGEVPLVSALATLAQNSRRAAFFEEELLTLLQLIDRGDVPSIYVQGSWAGGMGLTQFIPTTYAKYALDYDNDGKRDLWQTSDALASTGHYLQAMGWQAGYRWGREVQLPVGFNYLLANNTELKKSLSEWRALGVTDSSGMALPDDFAMARLFVPAGQYGPKFLLYSNFDVIKKYNNSDSYALAVSLLSDEIAGYSGLRTPWPNNAMPLTADKISAVQSALNTQGFNAGKVDGIMGNGTRRALQAYQAARGMVADGFLTSDLYYAVVSGSSMQNTYSTTNTIDINGNMSDSTYRDYVTQ